jgi:mRNA interferase MazF
MSTAKASPLRGDVHRTRGGAAVVVVSNDFRNRALDTVLCIPVTPEPRPAVPSVVELPIGEPAVGRIICDDITSIAKSELTSKVGALSRRAMRAIDEALRVVLGLDRDLH